MSFKASPFLFSLFLHLVVLVPFLSHKKNESSVIQIEILRRRSFAPPAAASGLRMKTTLATAGNDPAIDAESGEDDAEETTVLGSELGIVTTYPRLSRVLGERGVVLIGIKNSQTYVARSSGYARLDEAALNAMTRALQEPLLKGALTSRKSFKIRFIFQLTR